MATSSERELLELLVKKMGESSALNGGFDKLCLMIEHIQEEQTKSGVKLDKVSEALYDPNTGLFSRVRAIESKLDTNIHDLENKCKDVPDVKETLSGLKVSLQETNKEVTALKLHVDDLDKEIKVSKTDLSDLKKIQANLVNISGSQLEELDALIKLRKNLSKIYWALTLAFLTFVGKMLFEIAKRQ